MQLKRSGLALLMALFVLVGARELRADPILTQIVSSSFSGTVGAVPFGIQPFDPDLGTLLSVNVTINGVMSGVSLIPGTLIITQSFTGLGGQYL